MRGLGLRRVAGVVAMLIMALVLSACHSLVPSGPNPQDTLRALAEALESGDFSQVPSDRDPKPDWQAAVADLDGMRPAVSALPAVVSDDVATAELQLEWPYEPESWSYTTTATLRLVDDTWQVEWSPTTIHPELTAQTRFAGRKIAAERGDIVGSDGNAIMMKRDVQILGIDKTQLNGADPTASARALAKMLKINEVNYIKKVGAYGPEAFVEALVIRGTTASVPAGLGDIPGARAIPSTRILAPSPTFAAGLLGSVAPADEEAVKNGGGEVVAGQPVGVSGLQKRYDEHLRGTPGTRVMLTHRADAAPLADGDRELFRVEPIDGEPLRITLSEPLQAKAEALLAGTKQVASIVVVDPKTGGILVAANSPAANGNPFATTGRYPPGSTFKTVTALALIRKGAKPETVLRCDPNITVNGRQFKNYADFPSGGTGRTTLRGAFANSCNTAFISMHQKITPTDLSGAAAGLGMGVDHDAGFPVFYGSVPPPKNEVGKSESLIGQGLIEASPLAMAGVTATVAGGKTVIPYLVDGHRPTQQGTALTATEAQYLRSLMGSVVTDGSGRSLRGLASGAKTGTAEYGSTTPPRTHAWMVAYTDSYAMAVFVHDGKSGSQAAGPLIKAFLQ